MEVETRVSGLSREYIIHPGETLAEVIEDRGMSQRELALRTGVTEKHISTVVHGQKGISADFARRLEYALGIEASFWMNLQAQYDRELLEYEDYNSVTEEEVKAADEMVKVADRCEALSERDSGDDVVKVMELRKALGVSNLLDVPKLAFLMVERQESYSESCVVLAWMLACEKLTKDISVCPFDADNLRDSIAEIKESMFLKGDRIRSKLTSVFSECGIAFRVVPGFKDSSVGGYIKKRPDGSLALCVAVKDGFSEGFWMRLFGLISIIMSALKKRVYIYRDCEDGFSCDYLIDLKDYRMFVDAEKYKNRSEIKAFARDQKVKDFVIIRKLMDDNLISG